jgi:hypothetical protein
LDRFIASEYSRRAALILALPLAGLCQSYDVDLVQSVRDAPVHLRPSASAETQFTASKGTTMVWAAHMESGGFYPRRSPGQRTGRLDRRR